MFTQSAISLAKNTHISRNKEYKSQDIFGPGYNTYQYNKTVFRSQKSDKCAVTLLLTVLLTMHSRPGGLKSAQNWFWRSFGSDFCVFEPINIIFALFYIIYLQLGEIADSFFFLFSFSLVFWCCRRITREYIFHSRRYVLWSFFNPRHLGPSVLGLVKCLFMSCLMDL